MRGSFEEEMREIKLDRKLADWVQKRLPDIETLPTQVAGRYEPDGNLEHYKDVAQTLWQRFSDLSLAKAGFLHGLEGKHLAHVGRRDHEALDIVRTGHRLRALTEQDVDVTDQLQRNVLPSLTEPRGVIVLVVEQLSHVDPDGELLRWNSDFRQLPPEQPPTVDLGKYSNRFEDVRSQALFLRRLVKPVAEHFGMWQERDLADDAALLLLSPARFEHLRDFASRTAKTSLIDPVIERLRPLLVNIESVFWEWHHIASLDRRFEQARSSWREDFDFHRCGVVIVSCRDTRACYRNLLTLHRQMDYRRSATRDYLGTPAVSGYHALHTTLWFEFDDETRVPIAVRFVPQEQLDRRYQLASLRHLEQIAMSAKRHRPTVPKGKIATFTPDGRLIELPEGSTVLDFATVIHHAFSVLVRRARVNRQPADSLHRLSDGDIVWLELEDSPQPLPEGWKEKLLEENTKKLVKAFKKGFRPALEAAGSRRLCEQILSWQPEIRFLSIDPHDLLRRAFEDHDVPLPIALENAYRGKLRKSGRLRELPAEFMADWWLRQIGLADYISRGQGSQLPYRPAATQNQLQMLLDRIRQRIEAEIQIDVQELGLEQRLRKQVSQAYLCQECGPSLLGRLIGVLRKDVLVIHRVGVDCGADGFPLNLPHRTPEIQYFTVESTNRNGIAVDVLTVFHRQRVDVVEINARRIGLHKAVLRILIDTHRTRPLKAVEDDLWKITGISRVIPPRIRPGPEVKTLENILPPRRREITFNAAPEMPYHPGSKIQDDRFFYGMHNSLASLRALCSAPTEVEGQGVSLLGPKKVGKSSLILKLRRDLLSDEPECLFLYQESLGGQPWSRLTRQLRRHLDDSAQLAASREGLRWEPVQDASLADTFEQCHTAINCRFIVAIDEAIRLLKDSTAAGEEELILREYTELMKLPYVTIVWIGVKVGLARLSQRMQNLLRNCRKATITPLTPPEVDDFLRANKFGPVKYVRLRDRVADKLHQFTAGNPFWSAHLAEQLWNLAQRRPGDVPEYDEELLTKAWRQLVIDPLPFSDRYEDDRWEKDYQNLAGRLLQFLSQGTKDGSGKVHGQPLKIIRRSLGNGSSPLDTELRRILDRLQDRGTVVQKLVGDEMLWRISAPILAEHLRHIHFDGVDP